MKNFQFISIRFVLRLFRQWPRQDQGAALIITLLIVLSLTLLGLAILLQSNTEHMIATNERDATSALYHAEAALQLAKGIVAHATDVNPILAGPDADPATLADNGIIRIKDFHPELTVDSLNSNCAGGSTSCEQTTSVPFFINGKTYEAFRIGQDVNDDGNWEGPRGLVFVRADDNYDEAPAADQRYIDEDKRINVTVIARYPIRVDANGTTVADEAKEMGSNFLRIVGVSQRTLFAQFGPSHQQPAIVSRTDMQVQGSLDVCGACGSVHADTTLTVGASDVDICESATSTAGAPIMNDGGTAQIGNPPAQAPFIPVPIANPYAEKYVPEPALFNTTGDSEVAGTVLECSGSTKYFALVGDGNKGRVFKATWNGTSWVWHLIDILRTGTNTILDDCGNVVSGDYYVDGTAIPARANSDGSDNHFYDFTFNNAGGPGVSCDPDDDQTIIGITDNDLGHPTNDGHGVTVMLPGTSPTDTPDGNPDFNPSDCMKNNGNSWTINGGNVWSPMFNAVIFVYGNLNITGGPDTICRSDSPCNVHAALPGGVWRATFIVFNNVNAGGNPAYGPVRSFDVAPDFQYLLIAGRDVELTGTPGGGDICPNTCDGTATVLAGYAGFIRAHEQMYISGNATVNGVVSAEDAATCSTFVNGPGIQATGSAQIYYDCEHPPSDESEGVVLTSWEELNQ